MSSLAESIMVGTLFFGLGAGRPWAVSRSRPVVVEDPGIRRLQLHPVSHRHRRQHVDRIFSCDQRRALAAFHARRNLVADTGGRLVRVAGNAVFFA